MPDPAPAPLLLSKPAAARLLSIGVTTLDALVKSGELHPVRILRRVLFERRDLEQFIEVAKEAAQCGVR